MNRKQYRALRTNQPQGLLYFSHKYNTWLYETDTFLGAVSPQEARDLFDAGAHVVTSGEGE